MYIQFSIFYFHRASWHSSATLTESFPCVFLSCKANAKVQLAKTGHGQHSYQLVVNCVVLCIVCVQMCTLLLPPGVIHQSLSELLENYEKCHLIL